MDGMDLRIWRTWVSMLERGRRVWVDVADVNDPARYISWLSLLYMDWA